MPCLWLLRFQWHGMLRLWVYGTMKALDQTPWRVDRKPRPEAPIRTSNRQLRARKPDKLGNTPRGTTKVAQ